MIDINYFARDIEDKLNSESLMYVDGEPLYPALSTDRVDYKFLIHTDGGEYKDFDYINADGSLSVNPTNKIVKYINCEFDITGSRIDGVLSIEMAFNASLEVMIPLVNAGKKEKKLELVNTIRQVMDSVFAKNVSSTYIQGSATYNYGVIYQLADTGDRDKRAEIGDSINLNAYLSYFLVEGGINSSDFILSIDGERIPFIRLGFNRGSVNESNVPSDTEIGQGENVTTATVFGLNFDMALRAAKADKAIAEYIFNGDNSEHDVQISVNGGFIEPVQYTMKFNNSSINLETTKFASVTVSMVVSDSEV